MKKSRILPACRQAGFRRSDGQKCINKIGIVSVMKSISKITFLMFWSFVLESSLKAPFYSSHFAWARSNETIILISGDGPIGTRDPLNEFTLDGGLTYEKAWIIEPSPLYDVIPGTQYINISLNYEIPQYDTSFYRALFDLPSNYFDPSLIVYLHADNVGTVFLNGVFLGQQPFESTRDNFQDPPEVFPTSDPAHFHSGINILEFEIYNFWGRAGFDYKAEVSFVPGPPCDPIEPPQQRTQGYWRRQCKDDPYEDICALVDSVQSLSDHFDDFTCSDVCDLMEVDPPENDMCRKAERQFMALLLNLASGKLATCNCLVDGRTVEDVVAEIDSLLENFSDHSTCERAKTLADDINTGVSLVNCEDLERDQDDRDDRGYLTPIPNPSAFGTVIRYEVPRIENYETGEIQEERVSLRIYDITGRLVKDLLDQKQRPGFYEIPWNGLDGVGRKVRSGIYFYHLKMGFLNQKGKMILLQ